MINKNNELPSFVNETNLPNIVDKLTDAKNIKISNNKYGNRVQTVVDKIVKKADDVTKAIKQEVVNNSYSFKVGTGDVDVSTDVEDGFGEVGVKGVTYQNLFNDFSFSGEASKYITANENTIKWTKSAVTTFNVNIKYHNALVELNRVYTLVFYVYKNTLQKEGAEDSYNVAKFNIVSYNSGVCFIPVNKTGLVKVKLQQPTTTPSDGKPYLEVYKDMVGELEISYPILLEGDYTNDDKIPSQFEGIVGVGNKSKNLFDSGLKLGNISWETGVENNLQQHVMSAEYIKVRPNTKYIIHSNTSHKLNLYFYDNSKVMSAPSLEAVAISFTTNSTTEYIKVLSVNNTDLSNSRFQLEEGDVATSYEPYYYGHKIEILSCGDNIYDYTKITDNTYINTSGDIVNYTGWFSTDYIRVNKNKKYYFYNQKHRVPFAGLYCYYYDTNKNKIEYLNLGDTEFVGLTEFVSKHDGYIRLSGLSHSIQVGRMYASYDKTQILLNEPLMRLPNGICDEITRDGKLIRRVSKVVFDGSESWTLWRESSKTIGFIYNHNSIMNKSWYSPQVSLICDRFISKNGHSFNEDDSKAITQWNANNSIFIRINKNSLETLDVNGFKQWLQANPTTVYYELAEPVITELPAPYLRIFKDGHLTFNTLVAPESIHMVQLNKSAQIQNAIKESQSLDNRINVLENNYDNLMLSTISRLNDLEFNYTLK